MQACLKLHAKDESFSTGCQVEVNRALISPSDAERLVSLHMNVPRYVLATKDYFFGFLNWLTVQNLLNLLKTLCVVVMAVSVVVIGALQARKNSLLIKGLWLKAKNAFKSTGGHSNKGRSN